MTSTVRARALLLASLLCLVPVPVLGQAGDATDPSDGQFGQTISAPDAENQVPLPVRPAAAATPADGPDTGLSSTATRVAIDRPADGATTPPRFTVMGWAVDPESVGTGVDAVYVYLDGEAGRGYFLGSAEYGGERPDVAAQLGQPRFGLSGFLLQVEVAPGEHTLYVYARRRGGAEPRVWSVPASVGIVAAPEGAPTTVGRQPVLPGACARAPDGTCLNRPSGPSPTCQVIDADGQCLPTPPGTLPGVVGQHNRSPGDDPPPGLCTQYDASNRCLTYAGASANTFNLRAEGTGQMTTLSWSAVSGTVTYEVLRCNGANGQSCLSLAVVGGTRYQLPRTANSWYQVQARSGSGQVLASSNVVNAP